MRQSPLEDEGACRGEGIINRGGMREKDKASVILFVQLCQSLVLGSEAALGRDVGHQHDLPLELVHAELLAVDVFDVDGIERRRWLGCRLLIFPKVQQGLDGHARTVTPGTDGRASAAPEGCGTSGERAAAKVGAAGRAGPETRAGSRRDGPGAIETGSESHRVDLGVQRGVGVLGLVELSCKRWIASVSCPVTSGRTRRSVGAAPPPCLAVPAHYVAA